MTMAVAPYAGHDLNFNPGWMEEIILDLGDAFRIRIAWDGETALVAGVCAVAGGVVGHYAGGRVGALLGAGLASAAGFGVSTMVSLRDLWTKIRDHLQELLYVVFNYLRRLDPVDYYHAFEVLMACRANKQELVQTILEFIATKLGREVISTLAAA